jgi:hypothetical protein
MRKVKVSSRLYEVQQKDFWAKIIAYSIIAFVVALIITFTVLLVSYLAISTKQARQYCIDNGNTIEYCNQ